MKSICTILALILFCSAVAFAQTKPTVFISGEGNTSTQQYGHHGVINKHDQTIEMAQDFTQYCTAVTITLNDQSAPDYFVSLNREGHATAFGELGVSQIIVLNARKDIVFTGKTNTVKNAVKNACNAIAADWQANGRLAPPEAPTVVPGAPTVPTAEPTAPVAPVAPAPSATAPQKKDVAVIIRTTAKSNKYHKPETVASVQNDTVAYLMSKGLSIGTESNSKVHLVLIIDRPISKWIEITVQGQDEAGNILWTEKISDGGWGHLGGAATVNVLDKLHSIIDKQLAKPEETPQQVQPEPSVVAPPKTSGNVSNFQAQQKAGMEQLKRNSAAADVACDSRSMEACTDALMKMVEDAQAADAASIEP